MGICRLLNLWSILKKGIVVPSPKSAVSKQSSAGRPFIDYTEAKNHLAQGDILSVQLQMTDLHGNKNLCHSRSNSGKLSKASLAPDLTMALAKNFIETMEQCDFSLGSLLLPYLSSTESNPKGTPHRICCMLTSMLESAMRGGQPITENLW